MQIANVYILIKAVEVSRDKRVEIVLKTVRKTTATRSSLVYRSSIQGNKVVFSPGKGVKLGLCGEKSYQTLTTSVGAAPERCPVLLVCQ